MIFHLVMGIQIVMKVVNQIKLPEATFKFGRQFKDAGQTSSAVQPPKPKESLNGSAHANVTVAQVRSIIAAETEKCLNSMKELLAKQGLNKENSHNCSHQNGQAW